MQCRHEAVFNIGRSRPILDFHARGMYSLHTCLCSFVGGCYADCFVLLAYLRLTLIEKICLMLKEK
jgi:hypothetical protein